MRSIVQAVAALVGAVTLVHASPPAQFSGRLAAVPCANQGDIEIADASVELAETVSCVAEGGTIRLRNARFAAGGRTRLRSAGPTTPWAFNECSDPSDCNRCADDVVQQFVDLFDHGTDDGLAWRYKRYATYEPSDRKPSKALENADLHAHVQGFVRTNSAAIPYAGTYSGKGGTGKHTDGVVFFVRNDGGKYHLDALHDAWHQHPSGASILGRFLLFGDKWLGNGGYMLRMIDLDHHAAGTDAAAALPTFCLTGTCQTADDETGASMGGGVGMVKLASGGYLLLATGPGGKDDDPRSTDFFYVIGKPDAAGTSRSALGALDGSGTFDLELHHVGRWTSPSPGTLEDGEGAASAEYRFAENLTVIPECGTGDVYVIHSAAIDGELPALEFDLYGQGYWRLSRVGWHSGRPVLQPLVVQIEDNDPHECHQRSAATAWVTSDHRLHLYCSEYKAIDLEAGRKMNFRRTSLP